MKKNLFITAIALLALTSCKKDYTCECNFKTTDYDNGVATVISNTTATYKFTAKKKDSESLCDNYETSSMIGNTVDGLKSESTCTLK